jgi:choloylglycine hydrolase
MRNRTIHLIPILAAVIALAGTAPARACTTFCIDRDAGPVFGKNYDWRVADGLVIVNKRNVSKTAMSGDNPARWTSRFGSVTFNQYGRGMPCGGINEAGLVIEIMWLEESEYPARDDRPSLPNLQWIQYHLDRSATVADVIAGDGDVRISRDGEAYVHFLVADRTGDCASIEFIGGEMVAHAGETMPVKALTNDTYERSAAYLEQHEGFGGSAPVPQSRHSLDRFVRAATGAKTYRPDDDSKRVDYAFDLLASVAQGESTKWSIVYDVGEMRVYFRTHANPGVRYFDLQRFDFSCDSPVVILDVNGDFEADVNADFEPYTLQANRALVRSSFGKTSFLEDTPPGILEALAKYPESTRCVH